MKEICHRSFSLYGLTRKSTSCLHSASSQGSTGFGVLSSLLTLGVHQVGSSSTCWGHVVQHMEPRDYWMNSLKP